MILEAVEGPTGRVPIDDEGPGLGLVDDELTLDIGDALGEDTERTAGHVVRAGGVLPITINDDGTRRA